MQIAKPQSRVIRSLLAEAETDYQALLSALATQLASMTITEGSPSDEPREHYPAELPSGSVFVEPAFEAFIQELREHLDNHHRDKKRPKAFISYAWEDIRTSQGLAANQALQAWLSCLKNHLDRLGIETFLDLKDMTGNMTERMRQNVMQSDHILLIGTPRFKERTLTVAGQAPSNIAFELGLALEKGQRNADALLSLLYSGDFSSAFPLSLNGSLSNTLIRDCRKPHEYYARLMNLESPLGIIPAMLFGRPHQSSRPRNASTFIR